jgi:hypothetical protein
MSACLHVCLSACLAVCLSACLPVCLSACLPACLPLLSVRLPENSVPAVFRCNDDCMATRQLSLNIKKTLSSYEQYLEFKISACNLKLASLGQGEDKKRNGICAIHLWYSVHTLKQKDLNTLHHPTVNQQLHIYEMVCSPKRHLTNSLSPVLASKYLIKKGNGTLNEYESIL